MQIEKLPDKYQPIWQECLKLFPLGRPGDMEHAKQIVEYIFYSILITRLRRSLYNIMSKFANFICFFRNDKSFHNKKGN